MRCKAADDRSGEAASREASLSRASRISSLSRASRSSGCAMAQRLMPRIFVIFALFVAKMASADVVIDGSSEIVLPAAAPYAPFFLAE